ncbi:MULTISPECIES: hypothetical protein [Neorhizobium]|uniref:Transmembrane protein n=2 Tax=Neorhizobium galegae TaxID=399 RepID=A0A068SW19_NEOGA|nr:MULTISPECIES: hypothetical protein [Neorhizobium]MCJ9674387.1 hypothetical protein [Neorhizobium sp. SHOUNA12B]MCJ9745120.1 hypothetical protein [Neorhizobium sp. SHOUNA12A]MCJ9754557.1 hypothetical protein [Neorhizobium sp. BETTINA12A]MCQ1854728.1 hypothetical protein [Neorhizobium galegae]CDN49956.1 Hypothetical protein RG540_CH38000 [Neorhizobium galegae bv. orientalis str. HAMBI 540]
MLAALPLMIIPFILYNLAMLGILGGGGVASLGTVISSLQMLSGAVWTMTLGDVIIVVSLVFLFVEILKASRNGRGSLINHMLSMLVFIAYLVEFLLVRDAATQIFFILMTITFVDVIGGFAVAIRSAGRDVSIGL